MRKYIRQIGLVCGILLLYSCSDLVEKKMGIWDDNIKLSTKTVEFEFSKDSITIKTGGEGWWVNCISVEDNNYHDFESINMESSTYLIQRDDIIFKRVDEKTIFIKAGENPLKRDRIIRVSLEEGDYFDGITITQKSKTN
jgi:hypothetical protein